MNDFEITVQACLIILAVLSFIHTVLWSIPTAIRAKSFNVDIERATINTDLWKAEADARGVRIKELEENFDQKYKAHIVHLENELATSKQHINILRGTE